MSTQKALKKLLRVQTHELDVRKALVGRLNARLEALREEDANWATSLVDEKKALESDPQWGVAYLRYAQLVEKKRGQLGGLMAQVEEALTKEQEFLRQEYAQVRATQKYLSLQDERLEKAQEKDLQTLMDDRFVGQKAAKRSWTQDT